ncbi:MAG TPA: NAD-dependent epimerase/dehydratase family protein [bacterium]|nr:NAD-dependent epimerase/dehydratase family protein [bacterium]HQG44170.1 NAD-dependent epimerase/dehydratase family protein [bacterium]HQI48965.1 NAD-dependent epimerase/dehydratase family protein [bacterium]HQJ64597.1 NAD-dependent epimerase/dehydratase family protein [bacterium]
MKVLVTGSNGFIGSTLVQKLVAMGHQVRCLVRRTSDRTWLQGLPVEYVEGDLNDAADLDRCVAEVDRVYHLAGVTKARDEAGYLRGNYAATCHLLEACRAAGRPDARFIYGSSQAAAGPSGVSGAVTESDPPQPISLYGKAKLRAEAAVLEYARERFATIVRPPSVYGPRERDIFVYFKAVARGVLLLPGDGSQRISLVHVDDLIDGILLAGETAQARGRVYFLSSDEPCDWRTFGAVIARALHKKPLVLHVPLGVMSPVAFFSVLGSRLTGKPALLNWDKVAEMRQHSWVCSNLRARDELGFRPQVGLEAGIAATAAWYQKEGWL